MCEVLGNIGQVFAIGGYAKTWFNSLFINGFMKGKKHIFNTYVIQYVGKRRKVNSCVFFLHKYNFYCKMDSYLKNIVLIIVNGEV